MSIRCGDLTVLNGRLRFPLRGAWSAWLVLDSAEAISGQVTLEADSGLSMVGAVVAAHTGIKRLSVSAFVMGGAGGLATEVMGSYRSGKIGDPLGAIARSSGETLSSTISASLKSTALDRWTLGKCRASKGLDDLAVKASRASGETVNWRFLSDGSLWMGSESWESATLPDGAVIVDTFPDERRTVIAVDTPALLPGVDLEDVGKVQCVEHWIEPDKIRTWAWI